MSGPCTREILKSLFSCSQRDDFISSRSQRVLSGTLSVGGDLRDVPCDVYYWPNARSYTRQPAAEIHTIGSTAILDGIVVALCRAGARLAAPGEFTMRAFLAGRLDLTQAEAVLGV